MRMKDRIVVLVKAFSELGLKVAEKMVEEGASAVILLGSEEESQKGEALKEKYPQTVYFLAVNTGDISAMEAAAASVEKDFGKIDTMVNLQDETASGGLMEITDSDWERVIEANLSELYYSAHAFIPMMKKNQSGRVVVLTSVAGRTAGDFDIAYSASKTGAMGFVRGLAMEEREQGITVNSIAAGDLMNPEIEKAVIHAILYLGSDEAPWTTGDCMDVNGGVFMQN